MATAVVLAKSDLIAIEHLPEPVREGRAPLPSSSVSLSGTTSSRPLSAEDLERREELLGLLRRHRGNISAIARTMGKDRKQIQRWLKRYELRAEEFRC